MADTKVDLAPGEPAPRGKAVEAATSGRPELAQAWALIGILDEVKAIRIEQRRQARTVTRG